MWEAIASNARRSWVLVSLMGLRLAGLPIYWNGMPHSGAVSDRSAGTRSADPPNGPRTTRPTNQQPHVHAAPEQALGSGAILAVQPGRLQGGVVAGLASQLEHPGGIAFHLGQDAVPGLEPAGRG